MKLRTSLALIMLLFAGMFSASLHAQVGSAVVTAAANFTVPSTDTITLKAQIVSCGNGQLPLYNGVPISLTPNQTPAAPFTASNTGSAQSITFTVPGNNAIICGSQAYTTYALTWYDNGFPLAPTQTYRFADATTQTLSNLVPVAFVPPVLTNAAGALCPAATPIFTGFNNNYQIQCAANSPTSGPSAALPITGGTLQGNLVIPSSFGLTSYSVTSAVTNGVIQADQFAGIDMCAKINAALIYAINNSLPNVNGANFSGTQTCASNMFANLSATANTPVHVSLFLGNVHIQSSVVQSLNVSNFGLYGLGPQATQIEYTGASGASAVMVLAGSNTGFSAGNGINNDTVQGIFFYGDAANVSDGFLIQFVNRSKFTDISTWGASSNGFEVQGAVTNTYTRIHVSAIDAFFSGIQSAGHSVPQNGLVFGGDSGEGIDSTASTVIDPIAEGVSATGFFLKSAANMTFTGGTSELNNYGIVVNPSSAGVNPGTSNKGNSFFGTDLEANTLGTAGVDVTDNGQQNYYYNLVAASTCSSCASMLAGTGGGQYIIGEALLKTGWSGTFNVLGVNSDFRENAGTTLIAVAGITTANITQVNSGDIEGSAIVKAPIITSNGALPTCAAGTGVTSCSVTAGSTQSRGFLTITNSSATTSQVLATLSFSASLASVPFCQITQQGGTTYLALFSNSTTAAHFTVVNTQTVSGITTIQVTYTCEL